MVKRDGRREPFDRAKVLRGVRIACEKRPVSLEEIEALADAVERDLVAAGEAEVPSTRVGDLVIQRLLHLDPIAYIRFASVYREMKTLEAIGREVQGLLDQERVSQQGAADTPGLAFQDGRDLPPQGRAVSLTVRWPPFRSPIRRWAMGATLAV